MTVSPHTQLYILSLSLNVKKTKKRKKRKKDIYRHVLSADNITNMLNMCVCVYTKKIVTF